MGGGPVRVSAFEWEDGKDDGGEREKGQDTAQMKWFLAHGFGD